MSIIDEVEALRRVPYFATMDPVKLKLLAFASDRFQLPAGGVICHQGEPGDAAYILLDGEADIVVKTNDGRQLTVAKVPKNTFIGEMAVLRNAPRNATVVAASPITALKVGKDAFYQLLRDVPQLAFEVMRELAERVEDTTAKLRDARAKLDAAGLS
ncbi:MAG: cyclic nucleotide-binding domain-containing protein [Alphaproteobacteria bacterium]|nr:cyclic nucleotide-binding domain-containing protein [Alphaproteobacteria bacterium]